VSGDATTAGYGAEPHDTAALLASLCGDLLGEPDALIRYRSLTSEQARYDALVSAIKAERGKALRQLAGEGLTYDRIAGVTGLGGRQRVSQLISPAGDEDSGSS